MKKLFAPIKALGTLGWLGVIILLMAGVIEFASFSQGSVPFDTEMEKVYALTELEGNISQRLGAMQTSESFYVYSREYELDAQSHLDDALAEDAAIGEALAEMEDYGYFEPVEYEDEVYSPDSLIAEFNELRSTHRATFDQIVAAYDAGDLESAWVLEEEAADQNDELNAKLKELIDWVEEHRVYAAMDFPSDANIGVQWAALGFAVVIVLALLGYQRISATTRPLSDLANATTAIGGDQYRPELLGGLLKKGGPAGNLARALNELAAGVQARDAGLKNEIESLRAQLYESRRRRLKLFRDERQGGKQ
ncbi:MAG: hypothetical protein JW987_14390 [Anaerolineaceae bacterium]|nr:hypothetical protein [Anaerolineaceae bacterium]